GDGMCDGDDDGAYSIHILAVDSAGTKEEVGASWSFTVQLDTKAPNAPTSLSGGQGDTQISVSWSRPDDNLREQKVYVALGACTGGIFDGNADAGDSADGGDGTAWKRAETVENSVNSVTLSGSSIGLSLGEEAAVSVTAIDLAGNESAFSEPACIQRVKTDGFCERLAADGGKCESCTVRTPGRSQGLPIVLVAATAFALATWRRRR
ncbi:MAG: fibronectin type III domain-containing protein, partial [Myxococcales bacterium]|nr:fibronectin type III domain-containing protein [Myxococcales bacterium]